MSTGPAYLWSTVTYACVYSNPALTHAGNLHQCCCIHTSMQHCGRNTFYWIHEPATAELACAATAVRQDQTAHLGVKHATCNQTPVTVNAAKGGDQSICIECFQALKNDCLRITVVSCEAIPFLDLLRAAAPFSEALLLPHRPTGLSFLSDLASESGLSIERVNKLDPPPKRELAPNSA